MEYNIEGMECTGCANTVQKKLSEVAGVTAVTVDFATKKATVETDREIPFERVLIIAFISLQILKALVFSIVLCTAKAIKPTITLVIVLYVVWI